jgi:hypothetical protein
MKREMSRRRRRRRRRGAGGACQWRVEAGGGLLLLREKGEGGRCEQRLAVDSENNIFKFNYRTGFPPWPFILLTTRLTPSLWLTTKTLQVPSPLRRR